jgi:hypothetical protein
MASAQLQLEGLTDDQLLDEIRRLAHRERAATADLLRCLIEVDARRLYLREGCASLFTYCTQVLHLAEGAAYNRIEAARAARRFPILLECIADGSLTLTSTRLLAPHLTLANHQVLLEAARYKGKREIEVLIATLHPQPTAPTVLRKAPTAQILGSGTSATEPTSAVAPRDIERPPLPEAPHRTEGWTHGLTATPPPCEQGRRLSDLKPRHEAMPVSASDYRLQVTISAGTHDKLRRVRDLLRHAIPDGDIAAILDRALTLLLADIEKRRCGAAMRPRQGSEGESHTRHIPAAVKREVWRRDEGRCAFISGTRRCSETAFLEFHHVVPYADGGSATVQNIELRCRAHNQYEAALLFGNDVVREEHLAWGTPTGALTCPGTSARFEPPAIPSRRPPVGANSSEVQMALSSAAG